MYKTKDKLIALGAITLIIFTLYLLFIMNYFEPVHYEGKVIGVYVSDNTSKCIVEINGERVYPYNFCKNIIGDTVQITQISKNHYTIKWSQNNIG